MTITHACPYPGCPNSVTNGSACPEHTDNRSRSEFAEFYSSRAWQAIRSYYRDRHPVCEWPLCDAPSQMVDHIVPLTKGGLKRSPNLQALCFGCHNRKTAMVDPRVRRGDGIEAVRAMIGVAAGNECSQWQ